MVFDPTAQQLRCESCQALQPVPQENVAHSIVEYKLEDGLARDAVRGYGLETRTVSCQNCGAIVSLDIHLTATRCSFCSSNQVLELKDHRQVIRPESVVPFSIDEKVINDLFSRWVRSLWFRPNALKRLARVSEVRGVYIPYWVFDATVHSDWQALAGYYYYETEHYTERGADGRMEHKTRQVQRVRWVPASGSRTDVYDEFLICASKGLSLELAARLQTFDTSSLKAYEPEYLVGWCAEEYQIGLNESWQRAVTLMEEEQTRRCSGDVPGDTQSGLRARKIKERSFCVNVIIGIIVIFGCLISGFVLAGGKVMALFQPLEVLIICGASLGAMIIGNPLSVSIGVVKSAGA